MSALDDDKGDKHVYFEPKYLSDVEIKYGETYFHAHRAVLAMQCKYFDTLFQKSPETQLITLPHLFECPLQREKGIDAWDMERFLEFLYTQDIKRLNFGETGMVPYSTDYLAFYFQCENLTKISQASTIEWIKSLSCAEEDVECVIDLLYEAELYEWHDQRSFCAIAVAERLISLIGSKCATETFERYKLLSPATKVLILDHALELSTKRTNSLFK